MADHFHAVLWIDHEHAKVFRFNATEVETVVVRTHLTGHHLQHKAHTTGSGHQGPDKDFYKRVIEQIERSGAILLGGPGTAKAEFKHYLAAHRPDLDQRISGVESLDHPTDGELVAHGRRFFKADDRMHGQRT